jgi:hypothetical protein
MRENSKKSKSYKLLITLSIIIPLLFGISYAYFLAVIKGDNTTVTGQAANSFDINLITDDDGYITATNIFPIDATAVSTKAQKGKFRVQAGANTNVVNYSISFTELSVSSNLQNSSFKWSLTCTNDDTKNISGTFENASGSTMLLLNGLSLYPSNYDDYVLRIWLQNDDDVDQTSMMNGSFTGKITIAANMQYDRAIPGPQGWYTATTGALYSIKSNSTLITDATPSFTQVEKNYLGIYPATDDYGTSYYYRGAANNNWVLFAGYYWRIIRVAGSGAIKLVYSGSTAPTSAQAIVKTGADTYIANMTWTSTNAKDSAYAGYMYTLGQQHGYGTSSDIKNTLDTWYQNHLAAYSQYLSDAVFCNDRTVTRGTGINDTNTTFAGQTRLKNKTPVFTCPDQSDAFTVSDTTNGNGHLTYPIGLLSFDEYNIAGALYATDNKSFYLYNNENTWTMTPYNTSVETSLIIIQNVGQMQDWNADNTAVVRPVIALKANVTMTGTGTYNNPFVVQTS